MPARSVRMTDIVQRVKGRLLGHNSGEALFLICCDGWFWWRISCCFSSFDGGKFDQFFSINLVLPSTWSSIPTEIPSQLNSSIHWGEQQKILHHFGLHHNFCHQIEVCPQARQESPIPTKMQIIFKPYLGRLWKKTTQGIKTSFCILLEVHVWASIFAWMNQSTCTKLRAHIVHALSFKKMYGLWGCNDSLFLSGVRVIWKSFPKVGNWKKGCYMAPCMLTIHSPKNVSPRFFICKFWNDQRE